MAKYSTERQLGYGDGIAFHAHFLGVRKLLEEARTYFAQWSRGDQGISESHFQIRMNAARQEIGFLELLDKEYEGKQAERIKPLKDDMASLEESVRELNARLQNPS